MEAGEEGEGVGQSKGVEEGGGMGVLLVGDSEGGLEGKNGREGLRRSSGETYRAVEGKKKRKESHSRGVGKCSCDCGGGGVGGRGRGGGVMDGGMEALRLT